MELPLVSIIIPTYNRVALISETLNSLISQTYSNWECIIVDDLSSDNTLQVVSEYCEKDGRFRVYKRPEENKKGPSSCRNFGLEKANGLFIQFLDSDDFLAPSKLEQSVHEINSSHRTGKEICISNFQMFILTAADATAPYCHLHSGLFTFENILYKWEELFTIPIHCGFFSVELFQDFRFPEELQAKEDWIMWITLSKNNATVSFIDEPLALYRKNPESITMKSDALADQIKVCHYLKNILTESQFDKLLFSIISNYHKTNMELKLKIEAMKKSYGYKLERLIQKGIKRLGLLN